QGSCKTQYAAVPQRGGDQNFLRAHVSLVELLDAAKALGIEVQVHDESQYWEHRDKQRLLAELHRWNCLMAAVTGRLKDELGDDAIQAAMTEFSNFEHLEAE